MEFAAQERTWACALDGDGRRWACAANETQAILAGKQKVIR